MRGLVIFIGDEVQTICVVAGILRVEYHLSIDVNASVDEANCVNVELDGTSGDVAARNFIVLLLEIVGVHWPICSRVREVGAVCRVYIQWPP